MYIVEETIRAEDQAPSLKSWNEPYEAYRNFSHCDDGVVSELAIAISPVT